MAPPSIGVLPKLTPSSSLLPHAHSAIAPDGVRAPLVHFLGTPEAPSLLQVLLVLRLRGPEEAGGAELRHDGSLAGAPLGVADSRLCHLCGEGWVGGGGWVRVVQRGRCATSGVPQRRPCHLWRGRLGVEGSHAVQVGLKGVPWAPRLGVVRLRMSQGVRSGIRLTKNRSGSAGRAGAGTGGLAFCCFREWK